MIQFQRRSWNTFSINHQRGRCELQLLGLRNGYGRADASNINLILQSIVAVEYGAEYIVQFAHLLARNESSNIHNDFLAKHLASFIVLAISDLKLVLMIFDLKSYGNFSCLYQCLELPRRLVESTKDKIQNAEKTRRRRGSWEISSILWVWKELMKLL